MTKLESYFRNFSNQTSNLFLLHWGWIDFDNCQGNKSFLFLLFFSFSILSHKMGWHILDFSLFLCSDCRSLSFSFLWAIRFLVTEFDKSWSRELQLFNEPVRVIFWWSCKYVNPIFPPFFLLYLAFDESQEQFIVWSDKNLLWRYSLFSSYFTHSKGRKNRLWRELF